MENLRGALLMVAAMAAFAVEDALIKALSMVLPTGQVMLVFSAGGALAFAGLMKARGLAILSADLLDWRVVLRAACEFVGGLSFILAFTLGDLSTASAILQATPLAVVAGAALLLGERVGWRRWSAVGIGFLGVMIVIRPGMAGFDPVSLLAVVSFVALAVRDLLTRRMPLSVSSLLLSTSAYAAMVPGALLVLLLQQRPMAWPDGWEWIGLIAMVPMGMLAYVLILGATRIGEISVIAPFRFSRIVFALILAAIFFGERPDAWTYIGAGIIVASSGYAIWRERAAARRRAASLPPQGKV